MLFLNRYTKGRGLPGCKSVRAVERSHRYSNSSAWCSASRSEWLDILQKGMLCCRRTEGENCKCESWQRPSGTVTPPPKRHASYTTVTLQLLALHKAPHTKSMQITWPTGRVWHFGWSAHLHWRGELMNSCTAFVCCHGTKGTILLLKLKRESLQCAHSKCHLLFLFRLQKKSWVLVVKMVNDTEV